MAGIEAVQARLASSTVVLAVSRNDARLISYGYTERHIDDGVTLVGSQTSLGEVALKFAG